MTESQKKGLLRRMWATQMATLRGENEAYNRMQGDHLDRQAAKKERRALKMSKKIGRGNIRANRAAQTAENLRAAAERKRSGSSE